MTYRKRHARSRLYFSDALVEQLAASPVEASARGSEDVEVFEGCVAKLSEQDRLLMDLRYEPGATVQSVAEKVGRSTKAVYHALGRIRTWLLQCMQRKLSERRRT